MRFFNVDDLQKCQQNEMVLILRSYEDFRRWYLSRHDLSMFAEEDIASLLDDEKPSIYPCVPLESSSELDTVYLSLDVLNACKNTENK